MSEIDSTSEERGEVEPACMPRIYVASLSDYNDGRLHGAWLDAAQDAEQLTAEVHAMLATSLLPHAEEWAIHDYEGFGGLRLGEYESLERISQLGLGMLQHGPAFAAFAQLAEDGCDLERFDEAYRGQWPSLAAYAEELLDDGGCLQQLEQLPDWLQPYVQVDFEAVGRDLESDGSVTSATSPDGGVYVFDRDGLS